MDESGLVQGRINEREHEQHPELEFLNLSDTSINLDNLDDPGDGTAEGNDVTTGGSGDADANADEDLGNTSGEQLTMNEILERELAALLGQDTNEHPDGDGDGTVRPSEVQGILSPSPDPAPSDVNNINAINANVDPSLIMLSQVQDQAQTQMQTFDPGQPPPHEQYLSGLAAVFQAAQAIQAQISFTSLNADPSLRLFHPPGEGVGAGVAGAGAGTGESVDNDSDFSELIAQLAAQLEQAGAGHLLQPPPQHLQHVDDPTRLGVGTATANANAVVETFNVFALPPSSSTTTTPAVATSEPLTARLQFYFPPPPNPVPLTGQFPYYSSVFSAAQQTTPPGTRRARQAQQQAPFPEAGPSASVYTPPHPVASLPPNPDLNSVPGPAPSPPLPTPPATQTDIHSPPPTLLSPTPTPSPSPPPPPRQPLPPPPPPPERPKGRPGRRKLAENERKSYICDFCRKKFGRKSDAMRHLSIHTGNRPFPCPVAGCGKAFIQRSALHIHLRVHSGEKPHMCEYPLCHQTFGDSSSLARHRRTHTGKKPYACDWPGCDKEFTRRTSLTHHMRLHDPNWEPDPNVRYSFKPKKRRLNNGEAEVEHVDEDEDEEEDDGELEDPTLEESVRTLSNLLSQDASTTDPTAGPTANSNSSREKRTAASAPSGPGTGGSGGTNAQLVAAISAEIAAAFAQAQAQIQAEMMDEDDGEDEDDNEDEDDEEEGTDAGRTREGSEGNRRGGIDELNVSQVRTEPPLLPPSAAVGERHQKSEPNSENEFALYDPPHLHPPSSAPLTSGPIPGAVSTPAPAPAGTTVLSSPDANANATESASLSTSAVDPATPAGAPPKSNHAHPKTIPDLVTDMRTKYDQENEEEEDEEEDFPVPLRERKVPRVIAGTGKRKR